MFKKIQESYENIEALPKVSRSIKMEMKKLFDEMMEKMNVKYMRYAAKLGVKSEEDLVPHGIMGFVVTHFSKISYKETLPRSLMVAEYPDGGEWRFIPLIEQTATDEDNPFDEKGWCMYKLVEQQTGKLRGYLLVDVADVLDLEKTTVISPDRTILDLKKKMFDNDKLQQSYAMKKTNAQVKLKYTYIPRKILFEKNPELYNRFQFGHVVIEVTKLKRS